MAGARLGATGFAQLVDPAGTVVASTTGSGVGLRDQTGSSPAIVTAIQPLGAGPGSWHVVVAQSRAEIQAETNAAGLGWALLLVVAGLLAGVGTMVATIVRGRARTATAGAEVLGAQAVPAAPDPVPNLRALASPQDLLVATGDALAASAPGDAARVGVVCVRVDGLDHLVGHVGRAVVEDALAIVGRRLQRTVPDPGLVARLADDEFGVLCPAGIASEDVVVVALRVEQVVQRAIAISGWTLNLSATAGAADGSGADGTSAEALVQQAHQAVRSARCATPPTPS